MDLHIISSDSSGNAYVLQNSSEALLIECGVNIKFIKQALDFNLAKVVGCLVTHEHGDHAKSWPQVLQCGISLYTSPGTKRALQAVHHRLKEIHPQGPPVKLGRFTVWAFDTKHDCAQPVCYVINHPDTGNVLFLTDSYYCEYTFPGLHNIIIEANHCQEILRQRIRDGASPAMLGDRVITSHMSIKTCRQMLANNDLSLVNNIVLIHLSDKNSDAASFKREIQQQTGKTVAVAGKNQIIYNFHKIPF